MNCPHCNKEFIHGAGLSSHIRNKTCFKKKLGRIGKGMAHSIEAEILRRSRISEAMRKNPNAGGLRMGSGRGVKEWYESPIAGRVYLRSTYEIEYAKWLDENKINWRLNTTGFEYEYEGRIHKYYPDFYLVDDDSFVETKGYKTKKDEAKWKFFPHKLLILFREDLLNMGLPIPKY